MLGFSARRPVDLELRLSKERGEHLLETPLAKDQQLTQLPDGRYHFLAKVPDTLEFRWWIIELGSGVEVIQPQSIRKYVIDTARAVIATYENNKS